MGKKLNIAGTYGKWTVIEEVERTTARRFKCRCECGNESIVRIDGLTKGTSSGCRNCANKATKHGEIGSRLYIIWMGIANRCNNSEYYKDIFRCPEWDDFLVFKSWALQNGYTETSTIDRIDGTKNYEPSNCRWTDKQTQAENRKVISKNNTSGYKGVTFYKTTGKWKASISINNVKKHIGYYDTSIEAAEAYDEFVLKHNLCERTTNFNKRF